MQSDAASAAPLIWALAVTEAMAKKRNLEGYKLQRKSFIPPMKQLPNLREHSYVNDMLPELIWLGLVHDRKGYLFGSRVLEAVVEVTEDLPTNENSSNFALQSAYSELEQEVKDEILSLWKSRELLQDVQFALAPLVLLYEGFGMRFVGPPDGVLTENVLVEKLKESVANHLDKYETPGIVLHGSMMLTRMMAGKIRFAAHIDIPNFNAVIDAPGSDDARRAASFMRANAGAEWGMLELSNNWAKYFWDRGAELSPCMKPNYENENE